MLRDPLRRARALAHRLVELQVQLDREAYLASRRFDELRDSLHLVARQGTFRRSTSRAVFLVHSIELWDSWDGVVRAMQAAEDFEPVVVSIPRRYRWLDGFDQEEQTHAALTALGIPHLRLATTDDGEALRLLKALEPDLLFRQSQWDDDVAGELGPSHLSFTRLCLIPYETMNISQNVPEPPFHNTAVDAPYHRAAWIVFCANDLMREMARRDGALAGAQFRVTGHPKADRLRGTAPAWPVSGSNTRRVAWAAHHSIGAGWHDVGAFPLMADDMLAWARERPDIDFVLLPHPALLPFLSSSRSPLSRHDFDAWLRQWEALPHCAFHRGAEYAPVLAACDVLVTDGLSPLIDQQVLGKPLVHVERPGHRPFNEIGRQVLTGAHTVTDARAARAVAERFLAGEADPLRAQQQANVEQLLGAPGSVERIMAVLREAVQREREG